MEIDEKLSYSLFVSLFLFFLCMCVTDCTLSLQFDPAPRAGEPLVSRRVPDYFLVYFHLLCPECMMNYLPSSTVTTSRLTAYCTYNTTQLPLVASIASRIYLSLKNLFHGRLSFGMPQNLTVAGTTNYRGTIIDPQPTLRCHDFPSLRIIYGAWTLFTKGRKKTRY